MAKALTLAWSGVDLFFVLSGFLLGGILMDNRESKGYYKAFYARRFFRIFPLYYAFLAFLFALSVLLRFVITAPHLIPVVGYPRDFWPFPITDMHKTWLWPSRIRWVRVDLSSLGP